MRILSVGLLLAVALPAFADQKNYTFSVPAPVMSTDKANVISSMVVGTAGTAGGAALKVVGSANVSGNMGVGTTAPSYKLDIAGVSGTAGAAVARSEVVLFKPIERYQRPSSPVKGMMYWETDTGADTDHPFIYDGSGWRRMFMEDGRLVGTVKTLNNDLELTNCKQGGAASWDTVFGNNTTIPISGLYIIEWQFRLDVDADVDKVARMVLHNGSGPSAMWHNVFDDDDDNKDGSYTTADYDNNTVVQFKKGVNYNTRLRGCEKGGGSVIRAIVRKNMGGSEVTSLSIKRFIAF